MTRRCVRLAALLQTVVLLGAAVACSTAPPVTAASSEQAHRSAAVSEAAAVQPSDQVDLTLYFRAGHGASAHLVPVVRQVPMSDDLPRQALEQLLGGPVPGDGRGLAPVLPPSTRLLSLRLLGDTAIVNLNRAAFEDAAAVGVGPEHEALALAALVDTLTEFPTVQRARIFVEGRSGHPFWGWWGVPQQLVRDDGVIGPAPAGRSVPDADAFTPRVQRIGTGVEAAAVRIGSVGARMRVGYLQVTLELAGTGGEPAATVPRARARHTEEGLELVVDDVAAAKLPRGGLLTVDDPAFGDVRVAARSLPGRVRLLVSSSRRTAFYLHTFNSPTRIVLDVRTNP